eukprot:gene7977-8731_t
MRVVGTILLADLALFFLPIIADTVAEAVTATYDDDDARARRWRDWRPWVNSLFPQSAFGWGVRQLNARHNDRDWEEGVREGAAFDFADGAGVPLLMLSLWIAAEAAALAAWVWASERAPRGAAAAPPRAPADVDDDADVAAERARVADDACDDLCVARGLRKVYPSGKVAVESVSFGLRVGECFGLLGHNGAGKTTVIKALTGEHGVTAGEVLFPRLLRGGAAAGLPRRELYRTCAVAVCPQHDALWPAITAREHLEIYLAMRLGAAAAAAPLAAFVAGVLSLGEHVDKVAGAYSGGTKRKLGVALAMFTGGRVVFLDEPSTGMDPFSRRSLDNHLKARFGSGYTLV